MNPMTDNWTTFNPNPEGKLTKSFRYHESTNRIIMRAVWHDDYPTSYNAAHRPPDIQWDGTEDTEPWMMAKLMWSECEDPFQEIDHLRHINTNLLAALEAMLPIFDAFTQDELSMTTIDEALALLPQARAAIAAAKAQPPKEGPTP